MKKNILCAVLFLAQQLAAQDGVSTAKWQAVKVVADGNNSEWKKPLNLYDALSGILFTIANDSTTVYFCFAANDERKINKLMKSGWGISITCKEKGKKFEASMLFPGIETISASDDNNETVVQGVRADYKNGLTLYKLNLAGVSTKGFVTANGNIPLQNSNGVNIGIGTDSTQKIIIEIAVPLKELFPGNDAALNEQLALGVMVNALPRPKYTLAGSENGASFGGGSRGRAGGGSHRGGDKTGNDPKSDYLAGKAGMFEKVSFKQKFVLTKN